MIASVPYWRLSSFYLFYFATVGSLMPFFGLYLTDIGYAPKAIGIVNAALVGTKIIAPNIWAWISDHTGKRLRVITFGSFFAAAVFFALLRWQSFWPVIVITLCYSFFWNAILSQFDALTIQYLRKDSHRYSQVRVWGSIGFIASVTGLGCLFDTVAISYLVPISCCLLLCIWFSCLSLKEPTETPHHGQQKQWVDRLKQPFVIAFFITMFLWQFSFGAYYAFFSLYLENIGYSRAQIGLLWALGVFAEVVLFLFIHRIIPKVGVMQLLILSLLLTLFRWLIIATVPDQLWALAMAQCLHAFSFGAIHAASIELIRLLFKGTSTGHGIALYSACGFGVGGAGGAAVSGVLWEYDPQYLFLISALAVLIAMVVICFSWFFHRLPG